MRYIFIILISLFVLALLPAFTEENPHINIIYPKNNSTIDAPSSFLVGNTDPKASLLVNNHIVKVYDNGGFVEMLNLKLGLNNIVIQSTLGDKHTILNYFLTRSIASSPLTYPELMKYQTPLLAKVTKDYAVTRTTPDGDRLTPLPVETNLELTAKSKNSYKFKMGEHASGWINSNDIKIIPAKNKKVQIENSINSISAESNNDNTIIKINLTSKLPINIDQISKPQMTLTIYGAKAKSNLLTYTFSDDFIEEAKVLQPFNDIFKIVISPKGNEFWGYNYYYEGNTLVLKLRKPPCIDPNNLLKNKIITLDAGHGGTETGSIGPTGVPEKDINLGIAEFLKSKLEAAGAKVIMTREIDQNVDLYKRVDIAKANNSQVLLSIHNNALPDGKNPYVEHGSSSYYYQPQSLNLATSLQKALICNIGFKDNGIYSKSLVLTRANEELAVLVEVGFMIYPDEYNLLIKKDFQEKTATALYNGLEDFFKINGKKQ